MTHQFPSRPSVTVIELRIFKKLLRVDDVVFEELKHRHRSLNMYLEKLLEQLGNIQIKRTKKRVGGNCVFAQMRLIDR